MSGRCEEVDKRSSLPQDVFSVIVSCMPTKFAVRTSILSKRWRYTWTLTHNLEFDDIPSKSYSHVDRVLMLCKSTRVKTFRLHFLKTHVPNPTTVAKWISEAVRLNVSELDIQMTSMTSSIGLPLSLFTCTTLSKLSLKLVRLEINKPFNNGFSWECPPSIYLPNMKTLDITDNWKPFDINTNSISCDNIFKLIDGCPLLEDLSLKIHMPVNTEDFYFKIPTLKRLRLAFTYYWSSKYTHKVVLNVPNLEYLHIEEFIMSSFYVMEDLSSLVKAKVSCWVWEAHPWVELLKGLSQVRNLTIDIIMSTRNGDKYKHIPEFPHVKKLVLVGRDYLNLQEISRVLKRFCQLEHLCIKKEHEGPWRKPKYFPTSTLTKIVTMEYIDTTIWFGCSQTVKYLKFILKNAVDLKKLIVRYNSALVSYEGIERLNAELSMFPRASTNCQIQLAPYN